MLPLDNNRTMGRERLLFLTQKQNLKKKCFWPQRNRIITPEEEGTEGSACAHRCFLFHGFPPVVVLVHHSGDIYVSGEGGRVRGDCRRYRANPNGLGAVVAGEVSRDDAYQDWERGGGVWIFYTGCFS